MLARLPATLELALLATLIALVLGVTVALIGVYFRGRRAGMARSTAASALFLAIPDFLWGLILLLLFGVLFPLLPISGRIDPQLDVTFRTNFYLIESLLTGRLDVAGGLLPHMILPALALALPFAALIARMLKASLAEAEDQDYAPDRPRPRLFAAGDPAARGVSQRADPDGRARRRAGHVAAGRHRAGRTHLLL